LKRRSSSGPPPRLRRPPYHAEHDVEDRVGQGVVDVGGGEEVIEQYLDELPAYRADEPDRRSP
jgi:hypothetical protein